MYLKIEILPQKEGEENDAKGTERSLNERNHEEMNDSICFFPCYDIFYFFYCKEPHIIHTNIIWFVAQAIMGMCVLACEMWI